MCLNRGRLAFPIFFGYLHMPHQNALSQTAKAGFVDDLMERLKGLLPLLDRDETLQLLKALQRGIGQEIGWAEALAARQTALLQQIPHICEYPLLMAITL